MLRCPNISQSIAFLVHFHGTTTHLFIYPSPSASSCFWGSGKVPQPDPETSQGFFFFSFFFFIYFFIPLVFTWSSSSGVWFLHVWPFLNPTIEVVTFRLYGWCMLDVFLLSALNHLGHECQHLLSPCNWIQVCCFVLLVGCLTSQQQASVSQGRICSDNFTCCHTEIEVADQTFYLTQSQYTDTGPTSPSADPITPGALQGSHWSANFEVTGMTRPRKNPVASGIRTQDRPLPRQTP